MNPGTSQSAPQAAQKTPEAYANEIRDHSFLSQALYLKCGLNYKDLWMQMLRPNAGISPPNNIAQQEPLVTLRHIKKRGDAEIIDYKASEMSQFSHRPPLESSIVQLLFIRGHLSGPWLSAIGSGYDVDPEFFRRHIDSLQSPKNYDLPALPSASCGIVTLKITTICNGTHVKTKNEVLDSRLTCSDTKHSQQDSTPGASIVRRISAHGEKHFTLEQNISMYISKRDGGWAAIIWLDFGRYLKKGSFGPWSRSSQHDLAKKLISCVPVIQHEPRIAQRSQVQGVPMGWQGNSCPSSARLLHTVHGYRLNPETMRADSFYALSEYFTFAASSENQFLNFMHTQLEKAVRPPQKSGTGTLELLNFNRRLLEEHVIYLQSIVTFLRDDGDDEWPRAKSGCSAYFAQEKRISLRRDFEFLLSKSRRLVSAFADGASFIMGHAELKKHCDTDIQDAKSKRLSWLAYIFLPLQFTSAVFGMNIQELGTGTGKLVQFFAALVPLLLASLLLGMGWQSLKKAFERALTLFRDQRDSLKAMSTGV
ncbi:hypothetical protein FQN54_009873 [Arachnomyces sp. PD_36]|nr:hypothetical protein FQN54_009873 [Arachnomyces sp. PD_36]